MVRAVFLAVCDVSGDGSQTIWVFSGVSVTRKSSAGVSLVKGAGRDGARHFLNHPEVFLTDLISSGWCLGFQSQCPTGACWLCGTWCHRQVSVVNRIFPGCVNSGHWV